MQSNLFKTKLNSEGPMSSFIIRVECYCGYRGEETPQRFRLGNRQVEIIEIIDRWLASDYRYFKVKGNGGSIYIIRNDIFRDLWQITMFINGHRKEHEIPPGTI